MCWEQQSALMLHRTTQLYSADGVAQRGVLTHRLMSTAVAADSVCIRRDTERGGTHHAARGHVAQSSRAVPCQNFQIWIACHEACPDTSKRA